MDIEEFKEQLTADIMKEVGDKMEFDFRKVEKLNESYEAITIKPEGCNIGMNLNVDKLFSDYKEGVLFGDLVDRSLDMIKHGLRNMPVFDADKFTDYEHMKNNLVMEVVSAEANAELLKTIPHKRMEDMAVVYRFIVDRFMEKQASVLITNSILLQMGVTPEQLHEDALRNAPEVKPLVIQGMSEVLAEMVGPEAAELMGIKPEEPEKEQMYVASVPDKTHGASVIAYQDFMDKAAERAGGDFFILPSSIHELLIVPDTKEMDFKVLEGMVREVNETQVAPEDKLTDSVYHYDSKDKVFELAEKFFDRQNSKETELEEPDVGKKSVLEQLKEGKEEAANIPKKEIAKDVKVKSGETR